MKRIIVALALTVFCVMLPPVASADWPSYYGPAAMGDCGSCIIAASSGSNYWTNNRVYRPIGKAFELGYDNGTAHWSAPNSSDNPFYFPAYGYNYVWCWDDASGTVNPVTCQSNS